jgi:hypothetical protein
MPYGALNTVEINGCAINGSELVRVRNVTVYINVNQEALAVYNRRAINTQAINGIVAYGLIRSTQVYIAAVDNAAIVVASSAVVPELRYLAKPKNAVVGVSSHKVFALTGLGGNLFITVIADGATHRYSFEGVKA